MSRQLRPAALLACVLILAASCATTKLVHSWAAPGFDKAAVKKVLILGVSNNPSLRRTYEDTFAVAIEKRGFQTVSGFLWIPDPSHFDRDAIIARMKAEHVTHVLVTRIVKLTDVESYTPPAYVGVGVGYGGPGYYGSWSSYYTVGYSTAVSPGYTTVDTSVELETNFYDASKDKDALVWSGLSQTWIDRNESGEKIDDVVSTLMFAMRDKGVI